ncbi:S8 family serine peptidase [Kibdelosporangium philippinense]|uniref:S8 family serine peptidase n=1 Tax=Kibdelosporangium philippinense TaxID=211113 RepID=A0ABS8Z950_9PSEU|nr:S8 family serine peptidase [Kibdelosporangium philippinense]MCE7002382.1 S8 family serine peptidase [Kibdelosporangium philippinense]
MSGTPPYDVLWTSHDGRYVPANPAHLEVPVRRWRSGILLSAFLALTGVPAVAHASPQPFDPADAVTLITGDKVVPSANGGAGYLLPGPGRERLRFTTYQADGHTYVFPSDAMSLIANKVVDQRLFDITALRAYRGTIPLIVKYDEARRPTGGLSAINATAIKADPTQFWQSMTGPALKSSGIAKVWLDGKRRATLDHSVPQIGAPTAWAAGYTGAGTTVAVLDTGVDNTHPDLVTQEIGGKNFTDSPDDLDHYGHGTHVASIVAGTGAKSGGKYRGVAPGARILDVKVLDDSGSGADSGIIAGMQWAAEQGADIVNMSLGDFDTPEVDPLEEAVNTLSAKYGTLFVISAGNYGPVPGTIGSPGAADAALTVGAVDRDNQIAEFSSRGPRKGGGMIKPDITAPGVEIVAARHADGRIGTPVDDGYTAVSGTSMAAPHVAGAAALLAQQHPNLRGDQLKAMLVTASTPTPGLTPFEQGAGRVDSAKVLTQTVTSQPISLSFGQQQWPHTGKPAVTKEISYANNGTSTVTLEVKMDTNGGVFSVSPSRITIPAGGTASATVRAEVSTTPNGGTFGGAVVATSGTTSVRTAVEIDLEVESYDVTITAHDRNGGVPGYTNVFLTNLDTTQLVMPRDFADGKVVQRLAAGRYLLSGSVWTDEPYASDVINAPNLRVDGPITIDLDARKAKPVDIKLPDANAQLQQTQFGFERIAGKNRWTITSFDRGGDISTVGFGQIGPDAPANEATGQLAMNWTSGTDKYALAWFRKGGVHTGLSKVITQKDLATVNVDLGKRIPDPAYIGLTSSPHNARADWGLGVLTPVGPGVHKEFYGGENADWARRLSLPGENYEVFSGAVKHYAPGRTYAESMHQGVFGPAFPDTKDDLWVQQRGDLMVIAIPLFSDGTGNAGWSATSSASTKLYRNGELLGQNNEAGSGRFVIPAGKATYKIVTEATRTGHDQATKVAGTWTFQGDSSTGVAQHPASAIRFTPKLDENAAAPRGLFLLPVTVENQPGTTSKQRLQTVQVSYDKGTTWQNAPLIGGYAMLHHPADAKSVSLRATAADRAGNSVDQTIIDAYLLR